MAKKLESANVEFNMTPMIDVTFQLIIFFIITGQIVSEELAALVPPQPQMTLANPALTSDVNLIVNIPSEAQDDPNIPPEEAAKARCWVVHGDEIDVGNVDMLIAVFEKEMNESRVPREEFTLELRCDYRIRYDDVQTVLLAASDAGIPNMNITAIADPARTGRR